MNCNRLVFLLKNLNCKTSSSGINHNLVTTFRSRSRYRVQTPLLVSSGHSGEYILRKRNMATESCQREVKLPTKGINHQSDGFTNGFNKDLVEVTSTSASCLLKGGVIAVPTDTIYGVAGLAQNTDAINRIYEIKHRNFQKPIAISVATIDDIFRWSKVTVTRELLMDLLPGPVTVIFERSPDLNPALNPHTHLVGIRIPNHKFMQELAKECNSPIALTSANISGAGSCLKIEEFESLWPNLDLVVNGGTLSDTEESRLGSTVVDLSVPGAFHIIRPGSAYDDTCSCLQGKHKLKNFIPDNGR